MRKDLTRGTNRSSANSGIDCPQNLVAFCHSLASIVKRSYDLFFVNPLMEMKDVAHIWELGGGSHVSELVRVPITPDRFQSALYVIVLDLSKPGNVISHLLYWTDQIKVCKDSRSLRSSTV